MQTEITIFIIIINIIILLLISGIVLFVIEYRKRRITYNKEKQQISEQHQKEILATQLEMQTQTMQYIGREIHDSVGQKLTLASLYTQQLAYENKAPQITDKIENISAIINESLTELRRLSKSLTDDHINTSNINELLALECKKVNELQKCSVLFSSDQNRASLSYQVKSILLRIAQEFMQNSIKHSNCKNISVSISSDEKSLHLLLQDDGQGFDADSISDAGIGLINMKKRTALIGGDYQLKSETGSGTSVAISIPLP